MRQPGRQFLQIPGPTNVPDRILCAMARPLIDHRGREFAALLERVLAGLGEVFGAPDHVVAFPSSGTGAWEAAMVNALAPGSRVLIVETGHFAATWARLCSNLGLDPQVIATDWRSGADPTAIGEALRRDGDRTIRAVCVVHHETSTGAMSDIAAARQAIDAADHSALLFVDAISSLATVPFEFAAWRVDVAVSSSQKGLMLPPGTAFNAISKKAFAAAETGGMQRSYWDWKAVLASNRAGAFPYTPATAQFFGLAEALDMLAEETLEAVYARHRRLAQATRRAVDAWGLERVCRPEADCAPALTGVFLPDGHSADRFRGIVHKESNVILGNGLSRMADRVFRIAHLGDLNETMLAAVLSAAEMGLARAGIPHKTGGVGTALRYLAACDGQDADAI